MSTQAVPLLTIEQYLEIERGAETRSEYPGGAMHAMAGGARNHGRIVHSIARLVHPRLLGRECLTDATFIAEVLSPLTRNYDRGEKFVLYRTLPSFREYLLPDQDEIELKSIDCRLRLAEVYERVEFQTAS